MLPVPAIPEAFQVVLWTLGIFGAFAAALWAAFRWLIGRIDERFRATIQSESFLAAVDKRVSAGFNGAVGPLLSAQRELAGQVAVAKGTADAAHRRIDEHLEKCRSVA